MFVFVILLLASSGWKRASAYVCDPLVNTYDSLWLSEAELTDVVVVGGGVAGLQAMKTLVTNGVENAVLLEAQDYVGGRVRTHREGDILTEDGAEWIHGGTPNRLYGLAEELGGLSQTIPDSDFDLRLKTQSGITADANGYDAAKALYETCERNYILKKYHKFGYGKCYADRFNRQYRKSGGKKQEKEAWRHYLEMWVNKDTGLSDWNDQSAKDADYFTDWGNDQWDQWVDGYDTLVNYLMEDIPESKVKLSSPVCRIFWGNEVDGDNLGGRVLVVTADEVSYLAHHVITTVSVGFLKRRHSEIFTPALKKSYQRALAVSDLGIADKVQLGWDSSWWGERPLRIQIIFTESLPAEMWWLEGVMEFMAIHQQPTMCQAFVAGDHALAMEALPEETVKQHAVWLLANATGQAVPAPTFFRRTQWGLDEFMVGSYNSYVTVKGAKKIMKKRKQLAKPMVKNGKPVLLWAGEATSDKRYGTVDGAMDTGEKQAFRVIDYMDANAE
ncbi:spermine oxidase-like [Penaeus japonicus]|uniref:spermine oxidase-like n=1 Tax=Penaeus japonicus TaxID=27405 RepID=UPI001C70C58C|nr:spermine oxidase-like [Penaeus japonicus]